MAGVYNQINFFSRERPRSAKFRAWDNKLGTAVNMLIDAIASPQLDVHERDYVIEYSQEELDAFFLYDNSTGDYVRRTSAMRHVDITPQIPDQWFFDTNDIIYCGHYRPFTGFWVRLPVVATSPITISLQYWNGETELWTDMVSFVDNTSGFSVDTSALYWLMTDVPDWGITSLDNATGDKGIDGLERYWMRVTLDTCPPNDFKLSEWFLPFDADTSCQVTQDYTASASGGSRFVWVWPGRAFVRGQLIEVRDVAKLYIQPHTGYNLRYSSVVIDMAERDIHVVDGDPDCTPQPPLLEVNQYKLADILINGGSDDILDDDIDDQRLITGFMA